MRPKTVVLLLATPLTVLRWGVYVTLTMGAGALSCLMWGALQCALAPAHAFVLISGYEGKAVCSKLRICPSVSWKDAVKYSYASIV